MRLKRVQKAIGVGLGGLSLISGLALLSAFILAEAPSSCEDYCFNWFWNCYTRPELLEYCTNGMMGCLIDYCGWDQPI